MTYADKLAAISRTPCSLMVMTLDYCANTFGSAPCTATGTPCYNTYPTCKDKPNYSLTTKDYKFTSARAPLPFQGARPYIDSINYMPTEIKDNKTVSARTKIKLFDVPDTDVGIDPYLSQRSSVQGTFWKKLLARNPNYKGRIVETSEGFIGITESEFDPKVKGKIVNIKRDKKGGVEIELVDLLKSLSETEIPEKIDIKLVADIDASVTSITLSSLTGLDQPSGYVKIGDEIIYYTSVDTGTNQILGCTRAYFNTTAATHSKNDKLGKVEYFAPANPYDHLQTILSKAGVDSANIDTTAFTDLKTWPIVDVDRKAIITKPTKADKLYFELVDELDCKSWVNEDLKITIAKNIQNKPNRSYAELTDTANIVRKSSSVDLNDKSRISRIIVYWNKSTLGDIDDSDSYSRLDIFADGDAESVNEYDEEKEKVIYSRWLHEGLTTEEQLDGYIKACFSRQLFRTRDAQPLYDLTVELKDQDIKTGDFVKVTTDDMQEIDGNPITKRIFQIVKREPKGNKVDLKAIITPKKRIAFFAPASLPSYTNASESQKEYGFFTNSKGEMSNGDEGYNFY